MSKSSKTDLDALKRLSDNDIDFSDVPQLDESFFQSAQLRIPANQAPYFVRLEPDVLAWFQAQGTHYQELINAALRDHITSH